MDKIETDAKYVLNQLGTLSSYLTDMDMDTAGSECFKLPLNIMRRAMAFDVSVLYKITNVVDGKLLVEITRIFDPAGYRADLREGKRLEFDLTNPEPIYINEVKAFKSRNISCINVPGEGCDMVGYVYLPEDIGGGYLFGGDYCGQESGVKDYEASVCEIMCNFLSTILIKTQFEQMAVYDGLTGLHNSRAIKEEVTRLHRRFARKSDTTASIVLCDIDHFKKINDTHGHIQGDVILQEVGALLSESMRKYFDIAGRYGGEEFLLVFDETDRDAAFIIVERIREKIANHSFTRTDSAGNPLEGESIHITFSFGIAENKASYEISGVTEWIGRADKALYQSKEAGRNRTTTFEE